MCVCIVRGLESIESIGRGRCRGRDGGNGQHSVRGCFGLRKPASGEMDGARIVVDGEGRRRNIYRRWRRVVSGLEKEPYARDAGGSHAASPDGLPGARLDGRPAWSMRERGEGFGLDVDGWGFCCGKEASP